MKKYAVQRSTHNTSFTLPDEHLDNTVSKKGVTCEILTAGPHRPETEELSRRALEARVLSDGALPSLCLFCKLR